MTNGLDIGVPKVKKKVIFKCQTAVLSVLFSTFVSFNIVAVYSWLNCPFRHKIVYKMKKRERYGRNFEMRIIDLYVTINQDRLDYYHYLQAFLQNPQSKRNIHF